ncbi:MAG: M16 family metallopeptidase [Candidatus Pacearchaeota archaeon]
MEFEKRKLKNGMTVLFEKRDLPIVCYSISNPFGGAYENSDVKGVAHLFEHLLFIGTKTRTHEDISREIEKRGGILNAFTAQDVTTYWCKVPSEHVGVAMDILHDILINPTFDPIKMEKEKKVVIEEIKIFNDDPERKAYELIEKSLYQSPFGEGIIGSAKTVMSLTREKIVEIFKNNYAPEKYIVTVVGNVDIDEICKRLEKDFKPNGKKYHAISPIKKNEHIVEERAGIEQVQLIWAAHVELDDKTQYALEILNTYLASGMSSKLFLEIRERLGLAYTVRGVIEKEKNYGYYSIYAGTTVESIEKVKGLILAGIKDTDKMTQEDLVEARQRLIGLRKVSTEESINTMQKLIFTEIGSGNAEKYYDFEKELKKIKLNDVKSLAKNLLKNYSTVCVVPKTVKE